MNKIKDDLIKHHASLAAAYILEVERDNFSEWFIEDGFDIAALAKALNLDTVPQALADDIIATGIDNDMDGLAEALAFHTTGDHVYATAIKLAVLIGDMKKPKLSKEEIAKIIETAKT